MIKKVCLIFTVFLLLALAAEAATLKDIRYSSYLNKMRLVFDLEGQAYYKLATSESQIDIRLIDCQAGMGIDNIYDIEDWVFKYLMVKKEGQDLLISIPLSYPVDYSIYPLAEPSRLVVDFGRSFVKIGKTTNLAEGLEFFSIVKGRGKEYLTASVLKVDPKKIDIFPALARDNNKRQSGFWGLFSPAARSYKHFYKQKVSEIVKDNRALAGVNGTYFASSGRPLGMLMIHNELLAYPPVADRTALIISREGEAFIDSVTLKAEFKINERRYVITGINEKRLSEDMVIYTHHYGEQTGSDRSGYEITVKGGRVTDLRVGDSKIPDDGYVISGGSLFAEHLMNSVKKEDKVTTELKLIPYSSFTPQDILHIVGGGPRLLKRGRIYVSRFEEKFRPDIAQGRAARTAVGITESGELLFVAVDGRPVKSIRDGNGGYSLGASLRELAYLLSSLGAVEALNLDGGSSSTMIIGEQVVNRPITGHERLVSNAILLKSRPYTLRKAF